MILGRLKHYYLQHAVEKQGREVLVIPPFHLFDLESTSDTMILEGDGERARLFLHKGLCLTEPEAFAMCWASITSPYRDGSFCNSTLTL